MRRFSSRNSWTFFCSTWKWTVISLKTLILESIIRLQMALGFLQLDHMILWNCSLVLMNCLVVSPKMFEKMVLLQIMSRLIQYLWASIQISRFPCIVFSLRIQASMSFLMCEAYSLSDISSRVFRFSSMAWLRVSVFTMMQEFCVSLKGMILSSSFSHSSQMH